MDRFSWIKLGVKFCKKKHYLSGNIFVENQWWAFCWTAKLNFANDKLLSNKNFVEMI